MPRFAANLSMMFTEVPFLDRFSAAAAAGFEAVEFLFPYAHAPEEVRERVDAAGVDVVLFNMPPGNWDLGERGLAVYPNRAGEFSASLGNALDYADKLGVPRVHMMAGLASSADQTARSCFMDALREASDAAGAVGVDVLIEPLNPRDMPGYFLDSFMLAANIITGLNRQNVKLQYDIYHRQILHGDVVRSLEAMLPMIGHIQTAAVPNRSEPGTGELDDAHIFAVLDGLGYSGWVGCEYRPIARTEDGLAWLTEQSGDTGINAKPDLAVVLPARPNVGRQASHGEAICVRSSPRPIGRGGQAGSD
jgi:hydroxypyruvate isomerase